MIVLNKVVMAVEQPLLVHSLVCAVLSFQVLFSFVQCSEDDGFLIYCFAILLLGKFYINDKV